VGRVVGTAVAVVAALLFLVVAAAAGVVSAVSGGIGGGGAVGGCLGVVSTPGATPAGLSGEQARNAGVIVAVGERMRVPVRGWVIAVATAIQESDLINIAGGPDDSVGLFQQRPSQGWGTPEQIMTPDYAAGQFYERLLTVPGGERLPLTEAASILDIPVGTAKSRLHRGLAALRTTLGVEPERELGSARERPA